MKKEIITKISVIVLVIIIFSGCIENGGNDNSDYSGSEIITYNIMPLNNTDYYIYLPFLKYTNDESNEYMKNDRVVNKKGLDAEIMDYLTIKNGNGTFEIINTTHGKMINVSSNQNMVLEAYNKWENAITPSFGYELSTEFCYISNSYNQTIDIRIVFDGVTYFSDGKFVTYGSFIANESWQKINHIDQMDVTMD